MMHLGGPAENDCGGFFGCGDGEFGGAGCGWVAGLGLGGVVFLQR